MIASNRTRRATLKARTRTHRAAAKIRRQGVATLATHCIAAGLPVREARSVAGSLRKNATKANVTGTPSVSYTHGRARTCTRYTPAQVARIATVYRPRKPAYKTAAARLALAA
jgi:7-keto-8-aminopelargonate synthetase-like enzyme